MATVENGLVTAVGIGEAVITVSLDGSDIAENVPVSVSGIRPVDLYDFIFEDFYDEVITESRISLKCGQTYPFYFNAVDNADSYTVTFFNDAEGYSISCTDLALQEDGTVHGSITLPEPLDYYLDIRVTASGAGYPSAVSQTDFGAFSTTGLMPVDLTTFTWAAFPGESTVTLHAGKEYTFSFEGVKNATGYSVEFFTDSRWSSSADLTLEGGTVTGSITFPKALSYGLYMKIVASGKNIDDSVATTKNKAVYVIGIDPVDAQTFAWADFPEAATVTLHQGKDYAFSFDAVDNADSYTVTLYNQVQGFSRDFGPFAAEGGTVSGSVSFEEILAYPLSMKITASGEDFLPAVTTAGQTISAVTGIVPVDIQTFSWSDFPEAATVTLHQGKDYAFSFGAVDNADSYTVTLYNEAQGFSRDFGPFAAEDGTVSGSLSFEELLAYPLSMKITASGEDFLPAVTTAGQVISAVTGIVPVDAQTFAWADFPEAGLSQSLRLFTGSQYAFSFDAVDNADSYTVTLYNEEENYSKVIGPFSPENGKISGSVSFDAALSFALSLRITASGEDYLSAETDSTQDIITVLQPLQIVDLESFYWDHDEELYLDADDTYLVTGTAYTFRFAPVKNATRYTISLF